MGNLERHTMQADWPFYGACDGTRLVLFVWSDGSVIKTASSRPGFDSHCSQSFSFFPGWTGGGDTAAR